MHVTLAPQIVAEQKTKPTQHSVTELRARGIQPDAIVVRSDEPLAEGLKRKISNLCDVPIDAVVNAADARNLYEIPLVLHEEGLDDVVCQILGFEDTDPDLSEWEILVDRIESADRSVRIGIIGKYVSLHDAYLSVVEALKHGGFRHGCSVDVEWIQAEDVEGLLAEGRLHDLDGIVIPGGFGERGTEGKIAAAQYAREHDIPCLGLCLGLQMMTIDYARNVLGLAGANSSELDPSTPHPVIDLMENAARRHRHGRHDAPRRLRGPAAARLAGGRGLRRRPWCPSGTATATSSTRAYRARFDDGHFVCSGSSPDGRLVEFIELHGHPYWVGTQAHPELKSRPTRPAPLFRELDRAPPSTGPRAGRPTSSTWTTSGSRRRGRSRCPAPSARVRRRSARRSWRAGSRFTVARARPSGPRTAPSSSATSSTTRARWRCCPLHDDDTVTLVRQFRAALGEDLLELPAGLRDVAGEDDATTAARELVGGDRPGRRDARAPGHVPQLPGLLRRDRRGVPGHRPHRGGPRPAGRRGAGDDDRAHPARPT